MGSEVGSIEKWVDFGGREDIRRCEEKIGRRMRVHAKYNESSACYLTIEFIA